MDLKIIHNDNGYAFNIKNNKCDILLIINNINYNLHSNKISKSIYFRIFLENKDIFYNQILLL